jgi:hypothetical protein
MLAGRGPALITFRGRQIRRVTGFVDLADLTCPDGHRVKLGGFTIRGNGALTCIHRINRNDECGALIWLLLLTGSERRKHFFAADVEYRELVMWEEKGATLPEIWHYLRADFHREHAR